jgi:hypothetical protein
MSDSRVEASSRSQHFLIPRRVERWGVGLTAIGLIGTFYAPKSWQRWTSGTVGVLTGGATGLIYTIRVVWTILFDGEPDGANRPGGHRQTSKHKQSGGSNLTPAQARINADLEAGQASLKAAAALLTPKGQLKIKKELDGGKISDFLDYMKGTKGIDEKWRAGEQTQFDKTESWQERIARLTSLATPIYSEEKWLTTLDSGNPTLFDMLIPHNWWKDWYMIVEDGQTLLELVNAFPIELRHPEHFNHLIGEELRRDADFLLSYLRAFPEARQIPFRFDRAVGNELRESSPFWDQWLAAFPIAIRQDKDHFYDFATLHLGRWIENNRDAEHPLIIAGGIMSGINQAISTVGRHYIDKLIAQGNDKDLLAIRRWGLMTGWITNMLDINSQLRNLLDQVLLHCHKRCAS